MLVHLNHHCQKAPWQRCWLPPPNSCIFSEEAKSKAERPNRQLIIVRAPSRPGINTPYRVRGSVFGVYTCLTENIPSKPSRALQDRSRSRLALAMFATCTTETIHVHRARLLSDDGSSGGAEPPDIPDGALAPSSFAVALVKTRSSGRARPDAARIRRSRVEILCCVNSPQTPLNYRGAV